MNEMEILQTNATETKRELLFIDDMTEANWKCSQSMSNSCWKYSLLLTLNIYYIYSGTSIIRHLNIQKKSKKNQEKTEGSKFVQQTKWKLYVKNDFLGDTLFSLLDYPPPRVARKYPFPLTSSYNILESLFFAPQF